MSIYRLRARVRRNKTIFVLFNGPRESFDARICILKNYQLLSFQLFLITYLDFMKI